MNITISDELINAEELTRLKKNLGIVEEGDIIERIVYSAFFDYKEMLLGKALPTRADEIKQYRLYYLIKHFFNGTMPTETQVSNMFQLTHSESKTLIKNVKTRFRYNLEDEIESSLTNIIKSCKFISLNDSYYETIIISDNVLDELHRLLTQIDPSLEPIKKIKSTNKKYRMDEDTYFAYCNYFNISKDQANG